MTAEQQRPRRCLRREIGNPFSMFHEKGDTGSRENRWSMFRVILWGLFLGFLDHWPTEWTLWAWAAFATIAFALAIRDLLAMVPVREGFLALTALFSGSVGKRVSTAFTKIEEKIEGATT